jgi:ankyrin repeat protein
MLLCASSFAVAAGSDVADAAMRGDLQAVRTLLNQKADVNGTQTDGATALHWAVYRDNLELLDLLIGAGANPRVTNRAGVSPLSLAARYGNAPVIDRLLEAGADANERGPSGETPLMLAARNGNPDAIKLLAAAGADVDATENLRGTTALMWAAEQKQAAAVKTLLELGADHSAQSGPAGLPRNYMAPKVNTDAVQANRERRRRAEEAGRTYEEQLAFEQASGELRSGGGFGGGGNAAARARQAQQQEQQDQDVIIAGLVGGGSGGLTPLVFAAREGDLESAKLLVDAGADVNQVTEYGWSALLTATNNRNYRVGAFLLERGADPNIANKGGWTPLYLATDNRNIEGGDYPVPESDMDELEYIELLLDHGADPNQRIGENTLSRTIFTMQWFFEAGATPLVRAAQSGDVELIKLLLAHGADPKIPTEHGDTALTAVSGIGWVEGVTFERSPQESYETAKLLLDLGVNPNAANAEGRTALMGAAHKGRNDIIQLLVDRGADLSMRDNGSRDTGAATSLQAGRTWQAVDYADGFVRVGVQSALPHPETAVFIRKLMTERGLPTPPLERDLASICVVELCYPK